MDSCWYVRQEQRTWNLVLSLVSEYVGKVLGVVLRSVAEYLHSRWSFARQGPHSEADVLPLKKKQPRMLLMIF